MTIAGSTARIRQLVLACDSLERADQLQDLLALGAPYADPGVGEFGLTNAVFALGDQFLEIVVPVSQAAPASRFLERSGPGGYMAIFQTDDLGAVRARCDALNLRRVWNIDLEDISASHLHPADIGAAIVSIDEARPAKSWRWGGPEWQAQTVSGKITGADLTSPDPAALATRWADVLGLSVEQEDKTFLVRTADGPLRFSQGAIEALQAFRLQVPGPESCLKRADVMGLSVAGNTVKFSGIDLILEAL